MEMQPSVMAAAAATFAAVATAARSAWVLIQRRKLVRLSEGEALRPRATALVRRAATHFLGKGLRRRWLLVYALDIYLDTLHKRHQTLVVPGRVELPIDRCYIPLELRAGQTTEVIQLLTKSGMILLLGDPGTGKSALLSRIIRDSCRDARENRERIRIPIYVPLQQISALIRESDGAPTNPEAAFDVLDRWFDRFAVRPMALFESGGMLTTFGGDARRGLIVLFDGLDEIDSSMISRVEDFLINVNEHLSALRGNNLIIVASRRQALDFTPRLTGGAIPNLVPVELKPFTPAAIYSFLLRWPYPAGQRSSDEARRIFNQLRLNPTLVETCANPLALALYVNYDQRLRDLGPSNGSNQPDTRAAFFSDVVDYLMIRTRSDEPGVRSPHRPFRQARTNFFVAVVSEHIRSDEDFNRIDDKLLLRHANSLVKDGQSAEQALFELAKDTGIIVRNERENTWSFIHRSFLDYFLACALAAIARPREIQSLLLGPLKSAPLRYLEGFYLACGLMASRNALHLQRVLKDLGDSTFVGRYYPRAMLEAQAYFMPQFVDRIRFYCAFWRQRHDDIVLFRDLVAVLVDYQHACGALGRKPEVSVVAELGDYFESVGLTALEAAHLDVELAMKIANQDSVASVLRASGTEDAIVALYEPAVAESIRQQDLNAQPRLAAIVAEAALRSSLFSNSLAPPPNRSMTLFGRQGFSHPDEHWADVWPVRGTSLASALGVALPYIRSRDLAGKAEFPHLAVLSHIRPIRRLRNEVLFGDRRIGALLCSAVIVCDLPLFLLGIRPALVALLAIPIALVLLLVFRMAALRALVILPSCRILNLQPSGADFTVAPSGRVRMVTGRQATLRKWSVGRPRGSDGPLLAAYVRELPFLWRRFCPPLGDSHVRLAGGAVIQQMWTEDVRRLVRG